MFKYLVCTASMLCSSQLCARDVDVQVFGRVPPGTFQLIAPNRLGGEDRDTEPSPALADDEVTDDVNAVTAELAARSVPRIHVPSWMRGRSWATSVSPRSLHSASASCRSVTYQPFVGLSPTGEARRRLYFQDMVHAACTAGVPVQLFDSLLVQESRYNPRATSPAGAIGIAQLMPGTARDLHVVDAWNVRQNLEGGARYLRQQLDEFGDWHLALSAYNAGPGNVRRYDGVPPFRETANYVRSILKALRLNLRPVESSIDHVKLRRRVSVLRSRS